MWLGSRTTVPAFTALAWFAFGLAVFAAQRREPRLSLREVLRLGLWTTSPLLVVAWPLRLLETAAIPSFAAVAFGYGLLGLWLSRGLDDEGSSGEFGNNGEGGR